MAYNWIDSKDYTMDCFLLFDRWILRWILKENDWYGSDYVTDMSKALWRYPYVKTFCINKAPETKSFIEKIEQTAINNQWTDKELKDAENKIIQAIETFVIYAYPEVMERVNYIRNWNEKYLHALVDVTDKVVLDIGSGTGRLAFAAAKKAKRVYASEPCDTLREYMRDKIKAQSISNIKVLDGEIMCLPYEDSTFDIVLSGHVVGDYYDAEIAEMKRITKPNGWIVICNGEDEFKRTTPNEELTKRGFEWFSHESKEGGIIYNYRKHVVK